MPDKMDKWPTLSVIIPACNEAEHIEMALNSIIEQDYPNLEIIVINDRSTDGTGDILERLVKRDSRIHALHIKSLPAGWLGKVHAMHQGVKVAKSDWFLFTDADVSFKHGALRRTLRYALHHQVDHLALLPRVILNNFWIDLAVRTFGLLFLLTTRAAWVNRPNSKIPIGIGAFNLVKREIFNRTPGFEWLRLEPGDDYGLGLMINNAGGRTRFALADEDISVPWYANVKAMFKGLEKNLFGPGARYSLWRMLFMVFNLWALLAAPLVALTAGVMGGSWPMLALAGAAIGFHIYFSIFFIREKRSETVGLLMFPVGVMLFSAMMLWSGFICLKNGGIDWRGTHYPLEELREGQRVKF